MTTYKQCTLRQTCGHEGCLHVYEMVEWVPSKLAKVGKRVECQNQKWTITYVGAESSDPRSAHECKT